MKNNNFIYLLIVGFVFVFSSCERLLELPCSDVAFTIEKDSTQISEIKGLIKYLLKADIEIGEEDSIKWSINGHELVTVSDVSFHYDFEPGIYTICAKVLTPNCPDGIEFCKEIEIEDRPSDGCSEVRFRADKLDREGAYKFISNVTNDSSTYKWYVNDHLIENATNHYLEYDFLATEVENLPTGYGIYNVCLVVETPDCSQGAIQEYCKEVQIKPAACPDLSFVPERDGDNNAFYFFANFEGKDTLTYEWFINGELVDSENTPGAVTDHKLYWQFSPGVYEVCIMAETPECSNGVRFCKEIEIKEPICEVADFEVIKQDDGSYKLKSNIHIDGVAKLFWTINGELVGESTTEYYLFTDLPTGVNEVCLRVAEHCSVATQSNMMCKEVVVEEPTVCPELFFNAEQDGTNPAYNFTADFENKDAVSYTWSVYTNEDYIGGQTHDSGSTDHLFYWQFASGTYTICIEAETPDCPQGVSYCKEITIP